MRSWGIVFLLACSSVASQARAQKKDLWADWAPFLGSWEGAGSGDPGQGRGEFSYALELEEAVLVRHNFAEYPASKDKPAYRHDDLMVIYPGANDKKTHADYWDNEGHVIHYEVEVSAGKLVFMSDPAQAGARYRLTYIKTGEDDLKLRFEIAPAADRNSFKTYIEATARRKPRK